MGGSVLELIFPIARPIKLTLLSRTSVTTVPMNPRLNSIFTIPAATASKKVSSSMIPVARPLRSKLIWLASRDKLYGNPSPIAIPSNGPKMKTNSSPLKNSVRPEQITPNMVQAHKNLMLLVFFRNSTPKRAEKPAVKKNKASPILIKDESGAIFWKTISDPI